jgi:Arc/MetJ-type ribon-helix-helix transcriptional regulator
MAKRSTEKVIPKKPGRPATGRHLLTVRLPPTLTSNIEAWVKQQNDKPSRSEAIRRLLEFALKAKAKRQNAADK